ncbi:MAG: glutathione S-transferase N-terminal domain-containing protein [Pseudomonadota bacterium]|uniref:Glutathione S-transferase n=1 Tax=marine metagenome TaxID=408172 RepID=A0A381NTG6_9ZZZZ|nr:glutathione S-transferase N-terminal domain-containing protein [Pseudomonadota bacterium]MEC8868460.1 glutathione S-transferase N-terminal domain-containing protein [Pseudomonadota bacterium]MEC9285292.1 glutathione S-transferase N-terminal domain-containing protein [Pseudomonadota bacterium]MEE3184085.1 glutathione S-transferase N-terminal domain-containing protein [Pseudomonadota bacterium]HBP14296.1 glutathione S-transferase [Gammaproteobacteria bacterium]|tara:strand:- start:84 stop:737 length:654 start_codon:yes stop_codon:yes gene_type:complete
MLEFYTSPTPNGWKVAMTLEEMGLDYRLRTVNLSAGEQQEESYLNINPNGRIPAIVDDGFAVFESGAIMLYLAEKTGKLMPRDAKGRSEVIQWLMFQMAGIGPMQGQAVVFVRYFPEDIPAAKDRYINESRRLYEVLDRRLEGREWLVNDFSIADIANWSWIRSYKWARIPIEGLDNLSRWMDQMLNRPACERGANIPPSPGRADLVKKGGAAIVTT